MNLLILSCSTGGGHNAAARALCEAARQRGHTACVKDLFGLVSPAAALRAQQIYVNTVNRTPGLFRAAYRLGEAVSACDRRSPVYYMTALLADVLGRELASGGYDAVAAVHLFAAEALTKLRSAGRLAIPCVGVMTDYTVIPFWEETRCDAYFLPWVGLGDECIKKGIPAEKLAVTGIPVAPVLARRTERSSARTALGLPQSQPLVLLLSGSMGHGSQTALIDALLALPDFHPRLAVICGANVGRQAALVRRYGRCGAVMALGYERNMPLWLAACDAVVTKPGGLSSTEAAAARVPIVLCNAIPGCESANEKFFVRTGMALAPRTPHMQARAVRMLCLDEKKRHAMQLAQGRWVSPRSAANACAALERLYRGEPL